jgi:chemotaxis protein histidine kinase CheA/CheY-like chemotaxis protein
MQPDDELMALYLAEAGERLDEMRSLEDRADDDPEARAAIRRQLHALKGSSRMLGLREMAELSHRAEDLVAAESEFDRGALGTIMDELHRVFTALGEISPPGSAPAASPTRTTPPVRRERRRELKVPADVVDELADRGTRLRVVAVAAEGLADRLFRLAALAEHGAAEPEPRQVLATLATSLRQVGLEFENGQRIFRRLSDQQLDALLSLQVQPLTPFLRGLAEHARELGSELGKRIDVVIDAGEAQLDRRIVNTLREAFLHLVRNAVDHGLESPRERARAGKTAVGQIRVEAVGEGARVRLRVEDDGRGIDAATVLETAVQRGLISSETAAGLDPASVLQLVCEPGFSTRERATQISGRGIGLDAVAAAVRSVGGDLWLESRVGEGTSVTVDVPVARRGERVTVMTVGEHQLAVPTSPIVSYRRVTVTGDGGERRVVDGDGRTVNARCLADVLGEPAAPSGVLVEMTSGGGVIGVVADDVVRDEEVIVRPLPRSAGAPRGIEGISLLSSGRAVAVVTAARVGMAEALPAGDAPARRRRIRVLLVDDSRVTREMLRRLLEDAGFVVTGVGGAEDALAAVDDRTYDCVVTDIEMPGMDGLTLTRSLRERPDGADLPVIVVSTLDSPADRLAGLESGADAYITKQRLDARELIGLVRRVGGRT